MLERLLHRKKRQPAVEGYIPWNKRGKKPMFQTLPEDTITGIKELLLQSSIIHENYPTLGRIEARLRYVQEAASIHQRDVTEAHIALMRDTITTVGGKFEYQYNDPKPTSSVSEKSPLFHSA